MPSVSMMGQNIGPDGVPVCCWPDGPPAPPVTEFTGNVSLAFDVAGELELPPAGLEGDVSLKLFAAACDYRGASIMGDVSLNLRPCANEIDPSVIFGDLDLQLVAAADDIDASALFGDVDLELFVEAEIPEGGWQPPQDSLILDYDGDFPDPTDPSPTRVTEWPNQADASNPAVLDATYGDGDGPLWLDAELNGHGVLSWDQQTALDVSNLPPGDSAGTMYLVLRSQADPPTVGNGGLMDFSSDTVAQAYPYTDGVVYLNALSTAYKTVGNLSQDLSQWHILCIESEDGLYRVRVNGTTVFTTSTNTWSIASAPAIGREQTGNPSYHFRGQLARFLHWDRVLDESEHDDVLAGLQDLYGL